MKRVNGLMPEIADMNNLELAFWKAKKGKEAKLEIRRFQIDLQTNLLELRRQLLSENIILGNYHFFRIYDPKERNICAADFSERVVHHAVMNVCAPYFEKHFIYDTYACRVAKGTHKALERAIIYQRKYRYFLKMDVRKYFDSIDHVRLKNSLRRIFKDKQLLSFFDNLIDSYTLSEDEGKGLPIGNLTSQYLANFYLSFVDHYVKEKLLIGAYVRYMDDMVLWSNDKKDLMDKGKNLQYYMQEEFKLDLKQFYLQAANKGLPFLGFLIKNTKVELQQKTKKRFIGKYNLYMNRLIKGKLSQEEFVSHIRPIFNHISYAETNALRLKILQKREMAVGLEPC